MLSRCYPEALTEVRHWLKTQHAVAVATASAEPLARAICREIDPRMVVVASRLKPRAGGLVNAYHCYGENKVAPITALGGTVVAAYTDSESDVPMLSLAQQAVLVNATERTQQAVAHVLGQRLRCVVWGQSAAAQPNLP